MSMRLTSGLIGLWVTVGSASLQATDIQARVQAATGPNYLFCTNSASGAALNGVTATCTASAYSAGSYITYSGYASGDDFGLHEYGTLINTGYIGDLNDGGGSAYQDILETENLITTTSALVRYVTATITVDGTIIANGGIEAVGIIEASLSTAAGGICEARLTTSGFSSCSVNQIPFSNASPFSLQAALLTEENLIVNPAQPLGEVQVDASHTLQIILTPLDQNFQVVPSAFFVGSDGQIFPTVVPSSTPESPTVVMMLLALSVVAGYRLNFR